MQIVPVNNLHFFLILLHVCQTQCFLLFSCCKDNQMLSLVQRSKDSILSFSFTANERRGKMFHQFLLSLEIKKEKRWGRMRGFQKSLLSLTSSKILSLDNSKKTSFFLVLSSLNRIFAGRTIADGVGQKMILLQPKT